MAERLLEAAAAGSLNGTLLPEAFAHDLWIAGQETDRTEAMGWQSEHSCDVGVQGRVRGRPVFPNTKMNQA